MRKKRSEYDAQSISRTGNVIISIIVGLFSLICVIPFIAVIMISFTDEAVLAKNGYSIFPEKLSVAAYNYVLNFGDQIYRSYGITILITVVGTVIALFVTALFAYAISRKSFKYRKFFTFLAFFTMLFNGGLVPTYMVVTQALHLKNTIWALILPLLVNAFYIIILRTFFQTTVPDSIIESAEIDGAGEILAFIKIVLPISLPGLATIGLFLTLGYWNDWFNALLYIDNPNVAPLQYLLMRIESSMDFILNNSSAIGSAGSGLIQSMPRETVRMAMVVLATGPIILAYPFFQKYFVKGLTVGSVKE